MRKCDVVAVFHLYHKSQNNNLSQEEKDLLKNGLLGAYDMDVIPLFRQIPRLLKEVGIEENIKEDDERGETPRIGDYPTEMGRIVAERKLPQPEFNLVMEDEVKYHEEERNQKKYQGEDYDLKHWLDPDA